MKKSTVFIILIFTILSVPVFSADRVDMVVLLDNSISVIPFYDKIQNSLLKKIISEHLQPGDTFNLLSFADSAEVEISREIKNDEDIKGILAYSSLIQPMGKYTDLVYALRYLYKYTMDLPLSNRKKIIILTDGIHDPPPGSVYLYDDDESARRAVKDAADQIYREGWDVSIVQISNGHEEITSIDQSAGTGTEGADGEEDSQSERSISSPEDHSVNVLETVSDSLGSEPNQFNTEESDMAGVVLGIPLVEVPEHLGEVGRAFKVPLKITNRSNKDFLFSLTSVISGDQDLLKEKASLKLSSGETERLTIELRVPDGLEPGEHEIDAVLKLIGGIKTKPDTIMLRFDYQVQSGLQQGFSFLTDWRVIAVIMAILAAVVILLLIRRITAGRDGNSPRLSAVSEPEEQRIPGLKAKKEAEEETKTLSKKDEMSLHIEHGPDELYLEAGKSEYDDKVFLAEKNRPIQMHVFGQNTKLGISNVHWLGENKKRVIGSQASAYFRIFFVKVPAVIAHIECTGTEFVFRPVKEEYFPELDGPLENCLNKRIKVITHEEKLFFIEFRPWVSQLEKLNRILNMTRKAGKPDFEY